MSGGCSGNCGCGGSNRLIYSCSGAADVGHIADNVARRLRDENFGKMTCLAALGAGLDGFIASAQGADENLAIDGCGVACARKVLEANGAKNIKSYVLTEQGYEKGQTPFSAQLVAEIAGKISAE